MDDYKVVKHSITKEVDKRLFPIIKELVEKYEGKEFYTEGEGIVYLDNTDGIKYVYTLGVGTSRAETQDLSIGSKGASWFREMRGDGMADEQIRAANKWQALIDKLPITFYGNNPMLYYSDTRTDFNIDTEIDSSIRAIVDTFFDEKNITVEKEGGDTTQLIYAASLRLAVGISLVPQPVLGKIYFSLNPDGTLKFLTKEEAVKLENILQNVQPGADAGPAPKKTEINAIIGTLTEMLKGKDKLERNLVFNDDNKAVIEKITERQRGEKRAGDVPVEILKVTVNTIFLLKVKSTEYNVFFNRFTRVKAPVLRAKVLFDKVTMSCTACRAGDELIHANVIDYVNSYGNPTSAEISFDRRGLSLIVDGRTLPPDEFEKAVEDIKKSVFSKHLLRVECGSCAARDACVGYLCEEQRIYAKNLLEEGEIESVIRCGDCVYPESYVLVDGEAYTTNSVFFDVNERRLRLRADEGGRRASCTVCGRPYYRAKGEIGDLCGLCATLSLEDDALVRKQHALYNKYAGLLPIRKRMNATSKRCVEDQSIIVFKVGRVYHVFDKLAAVIAGEDYLTGKTVIPDGTGEV